MKTLLTFPGANGDTFLQWQAARTLIHYQPGEYAVGLGTFTTKAGSMERLAPLFQKFSPVPVEVKMLEGVTAMTIGGQPWHFGLHEPPPGFDRVLHCGYQVHPLEPVAIETGRALGLTPDQLDSIPHFPSFVVPDAPRVKRRLVFHCPLKGQTGEPAPAWRLLDTLLGRYQLARHFDILAVGVGEELEMCRKRGLQTEEAGWERTAELLAGADSALCGGSSVAALAGCLHTPCVRIGSQYENDDFHAFRPWINLAPHQLTLVTSHFRMEDMAFDFLRNNRRHG